MIACNLNQKIVISKDNKYKFTKDSKDFSIILGISDKRNLIDECAGVFKKRKAIQYKVKIEGGLDDEAFEVMIYHKKPLFRKPYAIVDAWEAPMFKEIKSTPFTHEDSERLLIQHSKIKEELESKLGI